MKRFVAILIGLFGLRLWLKRRRDRKRAATGTPEADTAMADELREALAQSRADAEAPGAADGPAEPELNDDLTARRRDVHDAARKAIDDLK